MTGRRHVAVVGAGLAGLRAAEAVLAGDDEVRVSLLGQEAAAPYTRPPLSKAVLAGTAEPPELALRQRPQSAGRMSLRLGSPVVSSDLHRHELTLSDGEVLDWDGLVIASGLRPRRIDVPGPRPGRYALRSIGDALALRAALASARHVVVVGAGVLGCEIASTASSQGPRVTLVDPEPTPLRVAVGPVVGRRLQDLHEGRGVDFRGGETVAACTGTDVVDGVVLSNGAWLPADVVVEAVGGLPNTEWLDASELDLSCGVLTGNDLLVDGHPDVAACGDVVRFPNPLFPGVLRRVEHWTMATETARRAALSLVRRSGGRAAVEDAELLAPFQPVPYFWSEQYGVRVQGLGMTDGADETVELERGAAGEVAFGHLCGGTLVGVTVLGMGSRLPFLRQRLEGELVGAGRS